jgi:hypothetical protein
MGSQRGDSGWTRSMHNVWMYWISHKFVQLKCVNNSNDKVWWQKSHCEDQVNKECETLF